MGLLDDAIRQHLELKRRHGADPSEVARQEQEALGPPRRGTAAEEVELLERDALAADETELYDDEEAADEELLGQTPRDDEAVAEPTPVPAEPLVPEAAPSEPRADELRDPEPESQGAELREPEPEPRADELREPEPEPRADELRDPEPEPRADELREPGPEPRADELRDPEPEPRADELREPEPEPRAQEPPRAATADQPTQTYDVADIPDPEAPGEAAPPAENDDERGEDVLEETPEFLQETPEHDRLWFEQKPPRDFDF